MRFYSIFILSLVFITFSCQDKKATNEQQPVVSQPQKAAISIPVDLDKILKRHGSLTVWNQMQTLSYEIVREGGNEKQIIDLISRNERIEGSNFKTGYNGKEYWLEADTSYKGNAKFYHNLMFYFYAMPFVLADEGIVYSATTPLEFEGVSYPGIKISYNSGVGESPEDEYFIHFDPETHRMKWLGYTVTFFSGEKSEKVKWIRYNDWKPVKGLLLPKSITWYKMEGNEITEPRTPTQFVNIELSEEKTDPSVFEKTEGAVIVE